MIGVTILFFVVGFTACFAWMDAEHLNKKHYIDNHTSRWVLRAYFFVSIGIFNPWWMIGSSLIFTALFDQLLNLGRGLPFWYLGTVAKWDIFFSKRKWMYVSAKILALLLGVFILLR